MDEDTRPVERETTVINTGGGGGGGGTVVALLVLVVIVIGAFLFFGGYLERVADKTDINVNVDAPEIRLPDIKVETPPAREQPAAPAAEQNKQ